MKYINLLFIFVSFSFMNLSAEIKTVAAVQQTATVNRLTPEEQQVIQQARQLIKQLQSGGTVLTDDQLLIQQTLMGVLWIKDSGEFEALSTQVFNAAKKAFIEYKYSHTQEKLAVVIDLDEGALNNVDYHVNRLKEGLGYTTESWNQWILTSKATAMPGSIEFVKNVYDNGGEVFFVSNRPESQREATLNNLLNVGIIADNNHLFMKSNFNDIMPDYRKEINSKGFSIVLYVSDSLNMFDDNPGNSNVERRAYAKIQSKKFGTEYFVTPNPIYGSFEASLEKDYYKNNPENKIKIRNKRLNIEYIKKLPEIK